MKSIVVDGQLSLFDEQPKVVNIIPTKEENKDNAIFKELIDKYRDKCTRIVKVEKKLYVEIGDQTLSYEADGEVVQDPIPDVINDDEELHLGDRVSFNYDGMQIGKIARIYNNGETVNVSWNNRQTAFYYKSVVKINA